MGTNIICHREFENKRLHSFAIIIFTKIKRFYLLQPQYIENNLSIILLLLKVIQSILNWEFEESVSSSTLALRSMNINNNPNNDDDNNLMIQENVSLNQVYIGLHYY